MTLNFNTTPAPVTREAYSEPVNSRGMLTKMVSIATMAAPILALGLWYFGSTPLSEELSSPLSSNAIVIANDEEVAMVPFVQDLSLAIFNGFSFLGILGVSAQVFRKEQESNAEALKLELLEQKVPYNEDDNFVDYCFLTANEITPLIVAEEPSFWEQELLESLASFGVSIENIKMCEDLNGPTIPDSLRALYKIDPNIGQSLLIQSCCDSCGMFSVLFHVLGALKKAESESYSGVEINFGKHGLYYDPERKENGENWWEYYFEPIKAEGNAFPEVIQESDYSDFVYEAEAKLSRKEAHELIQKYIQIRPEILEEVNAFVDQHFTNQGRIIGIHYRGTDKSSEAARMSYEQVFERVDHLLNGAQKIEKYKIFVATDEEDFVQAIQKRYPGKIVVSNAERSRDGKPLHFSDQNKYQMGRSALVDMLLLSRTTDLLRTSSNLSFFATLMSPHLRVFSLTERSPNTEYDAKISQIYLKAKAPDFGACSHGMFAVTQCMLGVFHEYESKNYGGIQVDFGEVGCYYDKDRGPNWWNYYFESVHEGEEAGHQIQKFADWDYGNPCWVGAHVLLRSEARQLIDKYFKIKPEIQQEVNAFVQEHFQGHHVISVHYRGTDKKSEAERTEYKTVMDSIHSYVSEHHLEDFKIFVASDETPFVEEIEREFPGCIITTQAKRSDGSSPLHLNPANGDPYAHGLEALFDAIALSNGNVLIRTASNLSLFSTYLNPDLPVILLSQERG